jgi:hypothetical protein
MERGAIAIRIAYAGSGISAPDHAGDAHTRDYTEAAASLLRPLAGVTHHAIRVIVETPKGSRNKYAFDEREKVFS